MNQLLLSGIVLLLSSTAIAQKDNYSNPSLIVEKSINNESTYSKNSWNEIKGTYQFRLGDQTIKPLFSEEIYNLIIASRLEEEDVLIVVNQEVNLFIPSKKSINSSEFVALENVNYSSK